MADFTVTLQEMLENYDDIGLNTYPIFDEQYRVPLNTKIQDHFLLREIGAETPEMFRLFLSRKMNEIMPEYNQFYESERLKIDPLKTLDISMLSESEQKTQSVNDSEQAGKTAQDTQSEQTNDTDAKSRSVSSSTPQQMLNPGGDYADSASDSVSETKTRGDGSERSEATTENTAKMSGTDEAQARSNTRQTGYSGHQAELLNLYRTTFLNIDLAIIERLDREGLFMNLWSAGDEFYRREYGYGATRTFNTFYPNF